MQTFKFVTKENENYICWCTTNNLKTFRDFLQYILDTMENPEKFILLDTDNNKAYNAYKVATDQYKMRKRGFYERMKDIQTGKWNKLMLEAKGGYKK